MANKKLTEKDEKQLLLLKSTYDMHVKSLEECKLRNKQDSIQRVKIMLRDVLDQMANISPDYAKKCASGAFNQESKTSDLSVFMDDSEVSTNYASLDATEAEEMTKFDPIVDGSNVDEDVNGAEYDDILNEPIPDVEEPLKSVEEALVEIQEKKGNDGRNILKDMNPDAAYDIIPLPSKGECYKSKIDRIPVRYMTGADENFITSPNLYESGMLSEVLMKRTIQSDKISVDELVSGDADAIMLFLRATSYGIELPISAYDPLTGNRVETVIDLSTLKYREFSLHADENGYFDFTLPQSKAKIKFKFLTKRDEKILEKLNKRENDGIAVYELENAIKGIKKSLESDTTLTVSERNKIISSKDELEKWCNKLSGDKKGAAYTKSVTNQMEMEIVSVNGNTDRKKISEFVKNMLAKDSLAFRRYVYDNRPGVDFEVAIKRTESDGGGSFTTFLDWDDSVFWHIS